MRLGHTSFKTLSLRRLKHLFRISTEAHRKGTTDVAALAQEQRHRMVSRRQFIANTAKTAALAGIGGLYQACAPSNKATQPVIAIIGAGIAGLHAAFVLQQAGYTATVYEGSPRIGGRIMSVPEMMGDGLWTEMGGEFIDSTPVSYTHLTLPTKRIV